MMKIIRKCDHCQVEGEQEEFFEWQGDRIWSCKVCKSTWTHISELKKV